jgi:hypothetical protein
MGFVAIHDSFFTGWVWNLPPAQRCVILYCIRKARWKGEPGKWKNLGTGEWEEIPRGTFKTTYRSLAQEVGVSLGCVQRALKSARQDGMILIHGTRQSGVILTLRNYSSYQDVVAAPDTLSDTRSDTPIKEKNQITTKDLLKEEEEEKEESLEEAPSLFEDGLDDEMSWARSHVAGLNGSMPKAKLRSWLASQRQVAASKRLDLREVLLSAAAHPARMKSKSANGILRYYSNWIRRETPRGVEEGFSRPVGFPPEWCPHSLHVHGEGFYWQGKLVADHTGEPTEWARQKFQPSKS